MLFIILGLVFAIISGLVYPSFAVFVGELLEVSYAHTYILYIIMIIFNLDEQIYCMDK